MPTKEEIIQRVKRSLEIKREMVEESSARLKRWQHELDTTGTITYQ